MSQLNTDLSDLKARVDLRDFVEWCWGQGKRTGKATLYHARWRSGDRTPSFAVYADGYKDFGSGESGDVFSFVQREFGLTLSQAVAQITEFVGSTAITPKSNTRPQTSATTEPPPATWQQVALDELERAESNLWQNEQVLNYLRRERGLTDETIRAFRLGYNPSWKKTGWRDPETGTQVGLSPGIIIPIFADGALWALRIRARVGTLATWLGVPDDTACSHGKQLPKYLNLAGSKLAGSLFNGDRLQEADDVLVVEGEFDAMLAQQVLGELVAVVTLGSASNRLPQRWQERLKKASNIYLALDNDTAGRQAAEKFKAALGRRVIQRPVPSGKDVTEFVVQQGGDLLAWFCSPLTSTPRRTKNSHRTIHINAPFLSDAIGDSWTKPGTYLCQSVQATGKTTLVSRCLRDWKTLGKSVILITPRILLTSDMARRMDCESQVDLPAGYQRLPDVLVTTLPSLIHQIDPTTHQLRPRQVVVIDEIEQVLAALFAATITPERRLRIFHILETLIKQAEIVVLLDADAGEVSLNFLNSLRDDVTFIINDYHDTHRVLYDHEDQETMLKQLEETVKQGKGPVAVACSRVQQALALGQLYAQEYGDEHVLVICRQTKHDPRVVEFMRHPDEHMSKYRVVFYTSSMGTGVDISKTMVAAVFGIFNRRPLTAYEMHQMLIRCRHAEAYHVWVDPTCTKRVTDPNSIYKQLRQREKRTAHVACFDSNLIDQVGRMRDRLCRLQARVKARENVSFNSLRGHFRFLAQTRYTVIQIKASVSAKEREQIKNQIKAHSMAVKNEHIELLLSAPVVTEQQYRQHASHGTLTPTIEAGHHRGEIEDLFAEPISRKTIKDFDKGRGRKRLELFESLTKPDSDLCQQDWKELADRIPIGDLKHAAMRRRLTLEIVRPFCTPNQQLSSDVVLTLDEINQHVLAFVDEHHTDFTLYFPHRSDYSTEPINRLRFVLRQIGLSLKAVRQRDKVKRYRLSPQDLAKMQRYVWQRQQRK